MTTHNPASCDPAARAARGPGGTRRVAARLLAPALAVAFAVLCSGCSSLITRTVEVKVTGPAGSETLPGASAADCTTLVIPTANGGPVIHSGTCMDQGVTFPDRQRQDERAAPLLSSTCACWRCASGTALIHSGVRTLYSRGRYVVVTLRVTNISDLPARFDGGGIRQTALQGHGIRFTEALGTESRVPSTCLELDGTPIRPGHSEVCQVIFNVPFAVFSRMRSRGAGLLLTDFGTNVTAKDLALQGIVYVRLPRRDERLKPGA